MRRVIAILMGVLVFVAGASATPSPTTDFSTPDNVLRWVNGYRGRHDIANVPAAVRALSQFGGFKDPSSAGVYVGFLAGILGSNPDKAEEIIDRIFPLPPEDHWVVVRSVAYSGLPNWKDLMGKFFLRMPGRQVMMEKYLTGKLPTLYEVATYKEPTSMQKLRSYLKIDKETAHKDMALEASPETLDTLWGYYFATGAYTPVWRIINMLPMSRDKDNADKLTIGSMAKYTLASNAARDARLLAMLKRVEKYQPKDVKQPLDQVIEAAEIVDTARIRTEALAAIENLKRNGPDSKRNVAWWGQVGEGAIAAGCLGAAVAGAVVAGLPCVVGGAVSSAAMKMWARQD